MDLSHHPRARGMQRTLNQTRGCKLPERVRPHRGWAPCCSDPQLERPHKSFPLGVGMLEGVV